MVPPYQGERSEVPFLEEVPRLLKEKGWSLRALARAAGIQESHLSRVLRSVDYKSPSADLTERVARALGLPGDYFPEYREARVLAHVQADPALREKLYDNLAFDKPSRTD